MRIAIIGAGWYGCHIARVLKALGKDVTIYERKPRIFSGISGSFGIRLHRGPHYPRSTETRKSCQRGFAEFHKHYPELIVRHSHSIYALGNKDADGLPPKVGREQFEAVCREVEDCRQILPGDSKWRYENLLAAMDIKEPSILLGERLRKIFEMLLKEEGIHVKCDTEVNQLEHTENGVLLFHDQEIEKFDYVVNATSYHHLLPQGQLPFDMKVVHQPCLALIYEDRRATPLPFSFITLDGWFPCIMPFVQDDLVREKHRKYILTHGKWTILGSRDSYAEAQDLLNKIDDDYVLEKIKSNCESSLHSFWPDFTVGEDDKRFKYLGWQSAILAKVVTNREFRSALTFEKDRIIHVIPGKVSNIFDVAEEVKSLVGVEEGTTILHKDGYHYVQDGVLDNSMREITEPVSLRNRNTCMLQTYDQLQGQAFYQ